jgi:hypothetical protein
LIPGVFGEVINAEHQMHWIVENVQLLRQSGAFEPIYTLLRSSCLWMEDVEYHAFECYLTNRQENAEIKAQSVIEVKCASSILYIMIVIDSEDSFREQICTHIALFSF